MGIKRWAARVMGFTADPPPRPIAEVLLEMAGRGILPKAGRNEALSVSAVLRGRNLICGPATLPLIQKDPDRRVARLSLLEQIDPNVPNVVTLAQTLEDLLFDGISWWRVTAKGADNYPTSAEHLDVSQVSLQPPAGRMAPLPSGWDPRDAVVYVDGEPWPSSWIIRFDSPNPGLLTAGGRLIRRAVLLDQTSALYADNPRPLDYFTPTEGADPASDDEVAALLAEWERQRKQRATAYVPAALTYNSVDTPTPADLQLVALLREVKLDLANAIGLDPEDLGVSTTSRTYQNGVDRRQDKINDTLSPYMKAITDRLSMGDVTKRGYVVAFDLDDYLRADPLTRAQVYEKALAGGWMDADEVRAEEGRPDLTPAQRAQQQAPAPVPSNVVPIRRAAMAADADAVTFAPDLVPLANVDTERRIIEGIVLPYGVNKVAWKNGQRWRFQMGSLVPPAELRRNKALRDHDQSQPLGKLVHYQDTPDGMFARYKIAEGPDGDRALAEAVDGIRDGWSVGVEINAAEPDPQNQGVLLVAVGGAAWRESSLLAIPAFDDARVTRVAAHADQGEMMTAPVKEPAPDSGAPPQNNPPEQKPAAAVQLNNDQLQGLLQVPGVLQALAGVSAGRAEVKPDGVQFGLYPEQISALLKVPGAMGLLLGAGAPTPPEQPERVDPTRRPAGPARVVEPEPYTFDAKGNLRPGKFDFSTDVISGFQGDAEALERATNWMHKQFADADRRRVEFATAMTDVASLNPNKQRPDMYVDQQEFEYPIWNAINKGTIADATPFVLPKFSTSSGLVAANVENTEPTPGVFTATSQTITPAAISGKVEISREAWDQGGNPQLSGLIWRQMVRAWFEALEAAAVAMLEAAAPTTITITTAAADSALEASLTSQLAPLQYVRGGFRMRDAFAQVDLYKALIAAKDSSGRKLFPVLGAQNATGTTQDFFSALLVAGLVFRPAWALAATSANSSNSYLFDRGDVSGWATAPQRLTFENISVAKIHMGIWGYRAMAITDITGVRRLAYDPV